MLEKLTALLTVVAVALSSLGEPVGTPNTTQTETTTTTAEVQTTSPNTTAEENDTSETTYAETTAPSVETTAETTEITQTPANTDDADQTTVTEITAETTSEITTPTEDPTDAPEEIPEEDFEEEPKISDLEKALSCFDAYVASISEGFTAGNGSAILFEHSLLGKGESLYVGEGSALTALVFNTTPARDSFEYFFNRFIESGEDSYTVRLSFGFYVNEFPYWYYSIKDENGKTIHGHSGYGDTINNYDMTMQIAGGNIICEYSFEKVTDGDEVYYNVTLMTSDNFDNNDNEYETFGHNKIYNHIKNLGSYLVKKNLAKDFYWESTISFEVR